MRLTILKFLLCAWTTSLVSARNCNLHNFATENNLDCGGEAEIYPWHFPRSVVSCSCDLRCNFQVASTFICNHDGKWYSIANAESRFDCLSCRDADCFIPTKRYSECQKRGGATRMQDSFCKCKSNKRFYRLKCGSKGQWSHSRKLPFCAADTISE